MSSLFEINVSPEGVRDYVGYGGRPPARPWPGGARVAISVVINVEEGAERSVARGDTVDDRQGGWSEHATHPSARNLALESAFEYGSRAGIWRLLRVLDRHQVRATAFACARALELNPAVARALVARGHEIANHGYQWDEHTGRADGEEQALIGRSTASLLASTGEQPGCWYSRDGVTTDTRRLIRAAGYTYDSNSFSDDRPYALEVDGARHTIVPYAGDTNDSGLVCSFPTARVFARYLSDTLELLRTEDEPAGSLMTVALHPRLAGRPAYAGALDRFLSEAAGPGVWFATRGEIARYWEQTATLVGQA